MNRLLGILCASASLGLSTAASALITVGTLETPGEARDVDVEGSFAYVVDRYYSYPPDPLSPGLRIIDVSRPAAPVEVGVVEAVRASAVEVVGNLAYLTGWDTVDIDISMLRILDASNPAAPVEISTVEFTGQPNDIEVVDGLAFVTAGSGFIIFDVSNPRAPVRLGTFRANGGYVWDIEVVGQLVYLVDGNQGMHIVDVSDPALPVEIGLFSKKGLGHVDVLGQYAYLGLEIVDVSDPTAPVLAGEIRDYGDEANAVGNNLHYSVGSQELRVADVSDVSAAVWLGRISVIGGEALVVKDGLAYVAESGAPNPERSGLRIIDLTQPNLPVKRGAFDTPIVVSDVKVVDGVAYLAEGTTSYPPVPSNLRIVDVSIPETPFQLGALETPGTTVGIAVGDDVVYAASGDSGLLIIDVSNPELPFLLSTIEFPDSASAVEVVDDLAYVAAIGSLRIVDVSDLSRPVEVGSLDIPSSPHAPIGFHGIAVVDGLAYVAAHEFGLRIIDVSDPRSPTELGVLDTPDWALNVEVVDGIAYVADRVSGLRIVDVRDPANPVELTSILTAGYVWDVKIDGDLAHVAAFSGGLWVFDIADPRAPRDISGFRTPSASVAYAVDVADGLVFAGTSRNGLQIVDYGPEPGRVLQVGIDIKPRSDLNRINVRSRGVVPIAILGSSEFSVADVDVATLAFGPNGAPVDRADSAHFVDVNGDGAQDLRVHFSVAESGLSARDLQACAKGRTLRGIRFEGCDAIITVPQ